MIWCFFDWTASYAAGGHMKMAIAHLIEGLAAAALPLGEVTPEEKDKKRKAATTGQKPHKAKKAKTEKVPAAKTGLETFFRRATEAA
eukprot:g23314.t1